MYVILIIIIFLLLGLIYYLNKKLKIHTQEELEIKEKNKEIQEENARLEFRQDVLKNHIAELDDQLARVSDNNQHIKEITQKAFEDYNKILDTQYKEKEQEYDKSIELLKESYGHVQDIMFEQIKNIKQDLDKISQTREAAIRAQLKEQEIKEQQTFYCPQVAETDLKDAKILREIEYKLNNPRILRMLIWSTYYQKAMNQVCANVLGGATVVKSGIYKITNQINNICYIGQSKDIATRWKNHAKAGLGIDTPAGNKLYRAMQQDGLENFSFELLEECTSAELNEKEKFYIELYQADNFGYNSTKGNE